MDDINNQQELAENENQEQECAEPSRREFVSKLVSTAGAVALAGLLAGSEDAGAAEDTQMGKVEANKDWRMGKFHALKLRNGFRVVLSGQALGESLRQAGLLNAGVNTENATITIEFTA
jgi:hypothetical protein